MKKLMVLSVLLFFIVSMSVAVYATEFPAVADNADLLSAQEELDIIEKIEEIRASYDFNITIVSIETLEDGQTSQDYVDNFYDYDDTRDGMVLLVSIESDDIFYWTYDHGPYTEMFDGIPIENLADAIDSYLLNGEYHKAYVSYINLMGWYVSVDFIPYPLTDIVEEPATDIVDEPATDIVDEPPTTAVENPLYKGTATVSADGETLISGFAPFLDNADFLTDEEEAEVLARIVDINKTYDFDVTFSLNNGFSNGGDAWDYADDYTDFDAYRDGVLIVFDAYDYDFPLISTRNYGDIVFNRFATQVLQHNIEVLLADESYVELMHMVLDHTVTYLDSAIFEEGYGVALDSDGGDMISGFDPLIDDADLLTVQEENALAVRINEIYETYDFDVTILTMDYAPGGQLLPFCDWYTGIDTARDGVIFALSMDPTNREYATSTRNFAIPVFSEGALDIIDSNIPPQLTDGAYADALNMYLDYTIDFLDNTHPDEPYGFFMDSDRGLMVSGYDPLIDQADLLTDDEALAISKRILEINETYDFDVTFLTMDSIPKGDDLAEFIYYYEGVADSMDGVIFAINTDPNNSEYITSTREYGITVFSERSLAVLDENIPDKLTDGAYADALNLYLDYTIDFLETTGPYKMPIPMFNFIVFVIVVPMVIALLIAAIVIAILLAQMNTAVKQSEAKNFVKKDSFALTEKDDVFVREHTTSVKKAKRSPSGGGGGGGGGRSGGGGSRGGRSGSF